MQLLSSLHNLGFVEMIQYRLTLDMNSPRSKVVLKLFKCQQDVDGLPCIAWIPKRKTYQYFLM